MLQITTLKIVDHGIEHEQYFQGCGSAFTGYDNVVTGSGEDIREAIDDCLNQIAIHHTNIDMDMVDTLVIEAAQFRGGTVNSLDDLRSESVSDHFAVERNAMAGNHEDTDDLGCEHHYYVSILYNI